MIESFISSFIQRFIPALKLFILAFYFDNSLIGALGYIIGIVLLIEAACDGGVNYGVVKFKTIDRLTFTQAFNFNILRSFLISFFTLIFIQLINIQISDVSQLAIISYTFFRALLSTHYFYFLRKQQYRMIMCSDLVSFTTGMIGFLLLFSYLGPVEIYFISAAVGELSRFMFFFIIKPIAKYAFSFLKISPLFKSGKWIWFESIVVVLINNLDKIIIANFIGLNQLGIYFILHRVSQLFIADPVQFLVKYNFSSSASSNREDKVDLTFYFKKRLKIFCLFTLLAIPLLLVTLEVVRVYFLNAETYSNFLLFGLIFQMMLSSLILLLVPLAQGLAFSKFTFFASISQLLLYVCFATSFFYFMGISIEFVILSMILSLITYLLVLAINIKNKLSNV